jgi:hypothetical protein
MALQCGVGAAQAGVQRGGPSPCAIARSAAPTGTQTDIESHANPGSHTQVVVRAPHPASAAITIKPVVLFIACIPT